MVKVNWGATAANTGVQNDLIIGFSIYSGTTPTDATLVYDLPWVVVLNPALGTYYPLDVYMDVPLGGGTYTLRSRAWKSYSLTTPTNAQLLFQGSFTDGRIYRWYSGGSVLLPILDQRDKTASQTLTTADIYEISFSFG